MNSHHSSSVYGLAAYCSRRLVLVVLAIGAVTGLVAQGRFTPVDLNDWKASDGIPVVDSRRNTVLLPGGSQISRLIDASRIEIKVVSRPVFTSVPADWASIEIGPASLTFVRDATGGGMVLLGDEPLALPFALPLDSDGRSQDALEFVFEYNQDDAKAKLVVGRTEFDIEATGPAGSIEVALSAGRTIPWSLDRLELRSRPVADAPAGNRNGAVGSSSARIASTAERASQRRQALASARDLFSQDDDAGGEKALTDGNRNPRNTAEWHLESANELIQAAFSLTRAGKPQKAAQLARRALEHTEKAARKAARQAGKESLTATAESTAAFIHERLLANYSAARSFYQSAALRQPTGQAGRDLKRLDRADKEARRKAGETVAPEPVVDEIVTPPGASQ